MISQNPIMYAVYVYIIILDYLFYQITSEPHANASTKCNGNPNISNSV